MSKLQRLFEAGHFVVTAEVGPPKGCDPDAVRKAARGMRDAVDAANLTDNQTAVVRMSSISCAALVQQEGLEAVIQMTVRDRNRIGLQSDLLGAAGLGIGNVVCMSGDHPCNGNHPMAKPVYDLDSITWLQTASRLTTQGLFQCGEEMKKKPDLFVGAVENPFAPPYEYRAIRVQKKVDAGAKFLQTQCVFDLPFLERFMKDIVALGLHEKVKILVGITPMKSPRMARHMQSNVPGLIVPEELCRRMEEAADPQEEGIAIAVETIQAIQQIKGVAGIHLMPVMWEAVIPVVVERAGLSPRPVAPEPVAAEAPTEA
ncbi:MAG: methylenetetrahydrofolate reductase [Armatimonadota bacterium]